MSEPTVRVRRCADLADDEREQIASLLRTVFADSPGQDWAWATDDWEVAVWDGDRLLGRLGIVERQALVGGHEVRLAGIGGVGTLPAWRGRGVAALALRTADVFLRDDLRADFGLLVCSESMTRYYERLGWRVVPGPLVFEQPNGQTTYDGKTMVLPGVRTEWPAGVIDLRGLPW